MADVNRQLEEIKVHKEIEAELKQRLDRAHSQVSSEAWRLSRGCFYIMRATAGSAVGYSQTDGEVRNVASPEECWEIVHRLPTG